MADNRAEASRLWQMMNRGGQMGMHIAAAPLAYAGGASVVPPPNYQTSYNPAGAYAEAGRTVPNRVSEQAMAMNQLTQPQGGVPSDLHNWNDPYGRPDDTPFYEQRMPYFGDESVVAPPTIPTEKQIIDSTVTAPEDERDAAFSRIHNMWARNPGGDWNEFEPDWAEGIGVPKEYIDFYMQVPLEAKMFAHENKGDAKIQSDFEEKYGFVLDVDVPLQGGMERSDLLNIRSTGIPTAP